MGADAFLSDLRGQLLSKPSWGSSAVRDVVDELEQRHLAPDMALPAGFRDSWFAGYAEAEAEFQVWAAHDPGRGHFPVFLIGARRTLRAAIQAAFGGESVGARTAVPGLMVDTDDDLERLSRYFTAFPLRDRGQECLLWQEAVAVHRLEGPVCPALGEIADQLQALRMVRTTVPVTPLTSVDPSGTSGAMGGGADIRSEEDECPKRPMHPEPPTRPTVPDSRRADAPMRHPRAAASS